MGDLVLGADFDDFDDIFCGVGVGYGDGEGVDVDGGPLGEAVAEEIFVVCADGVFT